MTDPYRLRPLPERVNGARPAVAGQAELGFDGEDYLESPSRRPGPAGAPGNRCRVRPLAIAGAMLRAAALILALLTIGAGIGAGIVVCLLK